MPPPLQHSIGSWSLTCDLENLFSHAHSLEYLCHALLNSSTKYGDIASREIGLNGQRTDRRRDRKHIGDTQIYCRRWFVWKTWSYQTVAEDAVWRIMSSAEVSQRGICSLTVSWSYAWVKTYVIKYRKTRETTEGPCQPPKVELGGVGAGRQRPLHAMYGTAFRAQAHLIASSGISRLNQFQFQYG